MTLPIKLDDEATQEIRDSNASIIVFVAELNPDPESRVIHKERFLWPRHSLSVGDEVTFKIAHRNDYDPPRNKV